MTQKDKETIIRLFKEHSNCANCPFYKECDKLEDNTYNEETLCNVILNKPL